jgi:hypothetical protein
MDLPLGDFTIDDGLLGDAALEDMLGLGDDFMLEDPA